MVRAIYLLAIHRLASLANPMHRVNRHPAAWSYLGGHSGNLPGTHGRDIPSNMISIGYYPPARYGSKRRHLRPGQRSWLFLGM